MKAPYDILRYFDAEEDELEVVEVKVDDIEWVVTPEDRGYRELNATLMVIWYQQGVTGIAVKHENRIVEFDLRDVILREGELTGIER